MSTVLSTEAIPYNFTCLFQLVQNALDEVIQAACEFFRKNNT